MENGVSLSIGQEDYRVKATARGHVWYSDEPEGHDGQDTGPTPSEILLSSLGSCTLITLKMYVNRKKWPIHKITAHLTLTKSIQDGMVHSIIERKIEVEEDIDEEKTQRLLQIANACPVHKLITGQIFIQTTLESKT